jgi:hypothetical protein
MRMSFSIALVIAVAACQKSPRLEPQPERAVGDFSYRMTIGVTPIEGAFSIESDTVTLDAENHSCRRLVTGLTEAPISHSFTCGGGPTFFRVVVNSLHPELSKWTSSKAVTKSRQVCVKWTVTKEGERICATSRKEIYTESVPVTGRLEVTAIAAVEKPI